MLVLPVWIYESWFINIRAHKCLTAVLHVIWARTCTTTGMSSKSLIENILMLRFALMTQSVSLRHRFPHNFFSRPMKCLLADTYAVSHSDCATHSENLGQTWLHLVLVTSLWHCVSVKSPLGSDYISRAHSSLQGHIKDGSHPAEIAFCFSPKDSVSPIFISPSFPHVSLTSVWLRFLRLLYSSLSTRPHVVVHQPGHPHLHRMFRDPQGARSPLLQDPVAHFGCAQYLRALGKPHLSCLCRRLSRFMTFHTDLSYSFRQEILEEGRVKELTWWDS